MRNGFWTADSWREKKRKEGNLCSCVFVWINLRIENIFCATTKNSMSTLWGTEQRESVRKKEGNPVSKAIAPLSSSWHRENIMQPLAPIESVWFIAQFETAKLLNCIRSAKIHSRTTEEIWKIKCHLGTVENFYLYSHDTPNMPHSVMIDGDARLHLTYLVMSCSLQGCLLLENSRKT